MGCMTLPDSCWNDSDTYTQLERTGKEMGGIGPQCNSTSPRRDKKVDKMSKKKKKVLKGIQREKKYHKCLRMNATSWKKFSDFLLFVLCSETQNLNTLF